jgi:hypothetical protein
MGNWPTMILCAMWVAAMIWFPRTDRGTEKQ